MSFTKLSEVAKFYTTCGDWKSTRRLVEELQALTSGDEQLLGDALFQARLKSISAAAGNAKRQDPVPAAMRKADKNPDDITPEERRFEARLAEARGALSKQSPDAGAAVAESVHAFEAWTDSKTRPWKKLIAIRSLFGLCVEAGDIRSAERLLKSSPELVSREYAAMQADVGDTEGACETRRSAVAFMARAEARGEVGPWVKCAGYCELAAIARAQGDLPAAEKSLAAAQTWAEIQTRDGPNDSATTAWLSMTDAHTVADQLEQALQCARKIPKTETARQKTAALLARMGRDAEMETLFAQCKTPEAKVGLATWIGTALRLMAVEGGHPGTGDVGAEAATRTGTNRRGWRRRRAPRGIARPNISRSADPSLRA